MPALVAIGAMTGNLLMLIGGFLMLGVGLDVGAQSGTLKKWWDTLMLPEVAGWVQTALLLGGIALVAIGAATGNIALLLVGLGLLGASIAVGAQRNAMSRTSGVGTGATQAMAMQSMPTMPEIPYLAKGAVIPQNREFLTVLGDQKNGRNLEAPESLIRQIVREESGGAGASGASGGDTYLQIDGRTFARLINPYNSSEKNRRGVHLIEGGV
mgnify:CR=1 FL=1